MPGNQHNHAIVPLRPDIDAAVGALPDTAADTPMLDTKAADAAFFDLEKRHSIIPKHVMLIVDWVANRLRTEGETLPGKPNTLVITEDQLIAGLTLASKLGAAQTIYDANPAVQQRWGVGSIEEHLRTITQHENDTPDAPPASAV